MSGEHGQIAAVIAPALHRERCDMGHKDWEGCGGTNGCEYIANELAAALIAAGIGVVATARAKDPERCSGCGLLLTACPWTPLLHMVEVVQATCGPTPATQTDQRC